MLGFPSRALPGRPFITPSHPHIQSLSVSLCLCPSVCPSVVSIPEHYLAGRHCLEDQVGTAWKRSLLEHSRLPRKRTQARENQGD